MSHYDEVRGLIRDLASKLSFNLFQKTQVVLPSPLVDGASIAVDAALSNNFWVTLGGNRALAAPTNLSDGGVYNFLLGQDATGSRTLTFDPIYDFGAAGTPTLTTAANAIDLVSGIYDARSNKIKCSFRKDAPIALAVAFLSTINVFTKNQSVTPVVLTDAATVATDASLSNNFKLTLTATGHVMGAPTNPTDGMVCNWIINSGAGGFTFTFNAAFDFGGAGAPTISVTAAKQDLVSAVYDATTAKWLASFRKGS